MLGSATKLKTARSISLTGDVTGSATFDGSKNVTIGTSVKNSTVQVATFTTTDNGIEVNFTFKRNMNVVWVWVQIKAPAGKSAGVVTIGLDDLMPEWAKCTRDTSEILGADERLDGVAVGATSSHIDNFCKCILRYTSFASEKHVFAGNYARGIYDLGISFNFVFTYMV